jgi:23S rRNA (uracil1939-C5)-methyltransferase
MRKQCAIEKKCGGCQFINKGYEASLEYKNKKMKKLFEEFHVNVHPIEGAKNPYGYRNKTIVAFDHQYHYGLYEESSHRVVPYDTCLLHDEKTDQILKKISQLFRKYRVSIYDPRKSRGDIRHVLIRRAVKTDQTLVTLVSNNKVFNGSKNFCKEMTKAFPDIKSIVLNVNQRKTSIVLGDYEKVLYGKGFIIDELCGLTFKISSKSFYQINHDQCEALYDKTLSLLKNPQKVLDTYCGIGTIGMIASKKAKEVIGVERNRDAIKDANDNKASNHINNIKFICDDATEFMKKQASMKASYDTIIMDPPRTGSTKEFIQAVKILNPKQIVYVSCGPDTQVRDLKEFKKIGYTFTDVYPFDMFPFTEHVETVVLMSRGRSRQ